MRGAALPLAAVAWLAAGCAHLPLAGKDLDRVKRPAFVSWIEDNAGPRSQVFRNDAVFAPRLAKLKPRIDPEQADRRLQDKLQKSVTRFEVSDRLRAGTLALLPKEVPWTQVVDAGKVGSLLESFLVEEVPASPPNFEELRQLGVDAVVEIQVREYGIRSERGRAGAFVEGVARMFFLDGGDVWRFPFRYDQVAAGEASLDPFQVAREPDRYRAELARLMERASADLARELTPPGRRGGAPLPEGGDEANAPPDDTNRTGKENQGPPPGAPDSQVPPKSPESEELRE